MEAPGSPSEHRPSDRAVGRRSGALSDEALAGTVHHQLGLLLQVLGSGSVLSTADATTTI